MTIIHCTSVLLKFLFSNLDNTFAKELAAGNVNTKNLEKVNSFPFFTKVGLNVIHLKWFLEDQKGVFRLVLILIVCLWMQDTTHHNLILQIYCPNIVFHITYYATNFFLQVVKRNESGGQLASSTEPTINGMYSLVNFLYSVCVVTYCI